MNSLEEPGNTLGREHAIEAPKPRLPARLLRLEGIPFGALPGPKLGYGTAMLACVGTAVSG